MPIPQTKRITLNAPVCSNCEQHSHVHDVTVRGHGGGLNLILFVRKATKEERHEHSNSSRSSQNLHVLKIVERSKELIILPNYMDAKYTVYFDAEENVTKSAERETNKLYS